MVFANTASVNFTHKRWLKFSWSCCRYLYHLPVLLLPHLPLCQLRALLSCLCLCMHACSVTSDSETPWAVGHQAPLSMGFFRQENWSGLPFPTPCLCLGHCKDSCKFLCLCSGSHLTFPSHTTTGMFLKSTHNLFFPFGHAMRHMKSQFTQPGIKPYPPHWKNGVLATGPLGKCLPIILSLICSQSFHDCASFWDNRQMAHHGM